MKCALIDCTSDSGTYNDDKGQWEYDCENCGKYAVALGALASLQEEFKAHAELMVGLRAYIKKQNELTPKEFVTIADRTWDQYARLNLPRRKWAER